MKNPYLEDAGELFGIKKQPGPIKPKPDEGKGPIRQFRVERMLRELAQNEFLGGEGKFHYTHEVVWGRGSGAIRVRVTPNLGVAIDRRTEDLAGDNFWVTKRVYKIKSSEYAGQEDVVAAELLYEVKELAEAQNDAAKRTYKLMPLLSRVVDKVKQISDGAFVYQSLKKHNDNYFTLLFSLKGAGVGQLVRQSKAGVTPAGLVEVVFYPDRGMIHVILTTVGIEGESQAWSIMAPYFVADFAPTQDIEEITAAVLTGLRTV